MPENIFWRMLEELPGQKAPLGVWRNRLGKWPLFDQVQRKYLLITGQRAASLECPTPCKLACPRRVIEYAPDDIEATCPEQESSSIKIADRDLLFYALKHSSITKAVCDAIGIEHKPSDSVGYRSSWRIGDFIPPRDAAVPVYMTIQEGLNEFDEVVNKLCFLHSGPIILMAPTRRWLSAVSEQMLEQRKSVFMAMEEELVFADNGNFKTTTPKGYLFRKLLPTEFHITSTDPLSQNIFRQHGGRWQIRFHGGEAVFIDRQKGAVYLTALLASPHQSISVLDLYNNGTMDEQARIAMKAGGFDVADDRYMKECRRQVGELDREIMEAEQFNDPGRQERLQREKDQLLERMKELIGQGGMLRKLNDPLKRPRDAVTKAIRRTIKNIRVAGMNGLADHTENSIAYGKEIRYKPSEEIYWDTTPIIQ